MLLLGESRAPLVRGQLTSSWLANLDTFTFQTCSSHDAKRRIRAYDFTRHPTGLDSGATDFGQVEPVVARQLGGGRGDPAGQGDPQQARHDRLNDEERSRGVIEHCPANMFRRRPIVYSSVRFDISLRENWSCLRHMRGCRHILEVCSHGSVFP